ncbi:DUF2752 domain containing protein [Streptomyces microflavus DSM 40593]|uniref:DUF2752 domain containing protein n=1 Tax=Streptomyces microflavus DSM 40593 TaxID=1303692 RepID=N0CU95_STRMI|nr:DUF2752 domain containing protein [Streptomyces microflavus DSM 40593]
MDNHRVDATPTPNPEAEPQGVGPWNMPLTVCPTPDTARPATPAGPALEDGTLATPACPASGDGPLATPARTAFEDGTPAGVGPAVTGPSGEESSQVPGPQGHGSVLKRRTGLVSRLATPLGILAAVTAAFAYVGTVDPNDPGHYPVCPLLKLTGVFCPGCGGLRSAHAFIHGDLGAAFSANAVATTGYFLFAAVWVLWLVRAWRGRPLRIGLAPAWWWGIGALLLIFTVVRNLPFGSALAP